MKRYLCAIAILLFLLPATLSFADNRNEAVYKTFSGDCYHAYTCSYLRESCYKITMEEAVRLGLRKCSRCDPPSPDFSISRTPVPYTPPTSYIHEASLIDVGTDSNQPDIQSLNVVRDQRVEPKIYFIVITMIPIILVVKLIINEWKR